MKLNLLKPIPKEVKPIFTKPEFKLSPIRWWNVSTEGDCEGRTTRQLGTFYGHVAEIAFSLANSAMYKLTFIPNDTTPEYIPNPLPIYQAARDSVFLDIPSGLSKSTVKGWLNCDEDVEVLERSKDAILYNSVYLKLKD